jgi:DNA primase
LKLLQNKGFKPEDIGKAGLAIKSQEGNSWYDRFRSRITFPVADGNGRVVGFSGRVFEPQIHAEVTQNDAETGLRISASSQRSSAAAVTAAAKYINTPQTLIYDKSQVLYGFDKAKQEIRTQNQVVIVEGQMDCLMSHQAGVKNVIAVSGTALTLPQLKTIKRLCDRVVSSFDTDAAGESATKRSLSLASQFEFECRVATIPSGKDPADAVFENPQGWIDAVNSAKPVVEFYFEKALREKNPATGQGKKEIGAVVIPWISALSNEIEKAHWVKTLAQSLGVGEEVVQKELNKNSGNISERPEYAVSGERLSAHPGQAGKVPQRRELLEERLLILMPLVGEEVRTRELQKHYIVFASARYQDLFQALNQGAVQAISPELEKDLELLRFKGEVLGAELRDAAEEFILCKRELEKECVKERLLALGEKIAKLEKVGDQGALMPLLHDFRALSETLKEFS